MSSGVAMVYSARGKKSEIMNLKKKKINYKQFIKFSYILTNNKILIPLKIKYVARGSRKTRPPPLLRQQLAVPLILGIQHNDITSYSPLLTYHYVTA